MRPSAPSAPPSEPPASTAPAVPSAPSALPAERDASAQVPAKVARVEEAGGVEMQITLPSGDRVEGLFDAQDVVGSVLCWAVMRHLGREPTEDELAAWSLLSRIPGSVPLDSSALLQDAAPGSRVSLMLRPRR
jgi:hypothetical protein